MSDEAEPPGTQVRVLTWNVQGSHGLDVAAAARVVRAARADVVALQEVQRPQALRLAREVSMPACRWVFKHWPVVHRAEGLAVLTPHRLARAGSFVVRRDWLWRWQRRVGLDASVDTGRGVVRVLDVHLSPRDDDGRRVREAARVLRRARRGTAMPLIVGDLNELPGGGAIGALVAAGWLDAWAHVHGDEEGGATNWTPGDRTGRPATQRLDYVLAPPGATVGDVAVIAASAGGEDLARLSDHLPLVATVRVVGTGQAAREHP